MNNSITRQEVENRILIIRNREVMLDSDVAEMYDVPTGEINRRIKKNPQKFPDDLYFFELSNEEKQEVIKQNKRLERLKFSPHNPKAFTEYGIIMMSTVLNTEPAIKLCHMIVETFIEVKKQQHTIQELQEEIKSLKTKMQEDIKTLDAKFQSQIQEYDMHFQVVLQEIKNLRAQIDTGQDNKPQIGFSPMGVGNDPTKE